MVTVRTVSAAAAAPVDAPYKAVQHLTGPTVSADSISAPVTASAISVRDCEDKSTCIPKLVLPLEPCIPWLVSEVDDCLAGALTEMSLWSGYDACDTSFLTGVPFCGGNVITSCSNEPEEVFACCEEAVTTCEVGLQTDFEVREGADMEHDRYWMELFEAFRVFDRECCQTSLKDHADQTDAADLTTVACQTVDDEGADLEQGCCWMELFEAFRVFDRECCQKSLKDQACQTDPADHTTVAFQTGGDAFWASDRECSSCSTGSLAIGVECATQTTSECGKCGGVEEDGLAPRNYCGHCGCELRVPTMAEVRSVIIEGCERIRTQYGEALEDMARRSGSMMENLHGYVSVLEEENIRLRGIAELDED